jgi:trehalose/maltose hydrolase-like predicted phosphorylase
MEGGMKPIAGRNSPLVKESGGLIFQSSILITILFNKMDQNWTVTYSNFNPKDHPLQESLCTLGNGYFATRAALEMEKDNEFNYPGTYLAGGYNRMKSEIQGKVIENEDLVNWPNWLYLTFRIGEGRWFSLEETEILEFETRLHLKEGILERTMRFRDEEDKVTSIISRRLVGMHNFHIAGLQWVLTPENWSGQVAIRSGIDGNIINNNVARYRQLNQDHIQVLEHGRFNESSHYLLSQTKQSQIRMAQAIRTQIVFGDEKQNIEPEFYEEEGFLAGDFSFDCKQGESVTIEKMAAIYTSRDFAISDPLTEARTQTERMKTFAEEEEMHKIIWKEIWDHNDIVLNTNGSTDQLVLRLHIFHLYQTVSHNSIDYDIGIPARGWHGEAYRGHIFWDELYIMPFINLHYPQLSRSLLMYRYRRLPEAFQLAKEAGFRGALFPWQSSSNGQEETQKIHLNPKSGRWLPDVSHLQYHVNAAIPYNVWHYYQSTGDVDFLLSHGAEIILSTALFWSSIAEYNEERGRYEIRGVMGPDEYHTHYPDAEEPGLNNNAYTNVMAVWVLQHALNLMELFDKACCKNLQERTGITETDIERWKDITTKMYIPFKEDVIMQFDGFEKLKDLDWDYYHREYGKSLRLDRILESEGDSCNYYQAAKQADVLMLFYLFSAEELKRIFNKLGHDFDPETIPQIIDYYNKRTAHGSTLSQVIHAWVWARSHREESWKSFREALMSDFKDVQGGTTHEGIHLGAMAGTLDLIQRCYSGMEIGEDVLWFNPQLPDDIQSMSFHVRYRSHWIKLDINHKRIIIDFDKGWANPVTIGVKGKTHLFETNDRKEFLL